MSLPVYENVRRFVFEHTQHHRAVLLAIRGVEALVERGAAPSLADLQRALEDLARVFRRCVQREECGLHDCLHEAFPTMRDELEWRHREHEALLMNLQLLADACQRERDTGPTSVLSVRVRATMAALRRHEGDEVRLYNRATLLCNAA